MILPSLPIDLLILFLSERVGIYPFGWNWMCGRVIDLFTSHVVRRRREFERRRRRRRGGRRRGGCPSGKRWRRRRRRRRRRESGDQDSTSGWRRRRSAISRRLFPWPLVRKDAHPEGQRRVAVLARLGHAPTQDFPAHREQVFRDGRHHHDPPLQFGSGEYIPLTHL